MKEPDEAPDYPPRQVVITWIPGEPLDVDPRPTGAWQTWEVRVILEEAIDAWAYMPDEEAADS